MEIMVRTTAVSHMVTRDSIRSIHVTDIIPIFILLHGEAPVLTDETGSERAGRL